MAQALTARQRIAAGLETAGARVAASRLVPHLTGSSFTPNEARQQLDEPRGVLAYVDDVVTRRETTLELQQEMDWDLCLLAFLCGIQNVAGVADVTNTTPYTYTMAVGPTTPPAKASATWEILQSDGTNDWVERRFGNARPTTIGIEWQDGGTTRLNTTWMGGADESVSKATLDPGTLATRRVVPAALWNIYIDDAWGDLGDTKALNVRTLSWALTVGLQPSYHLTGRENLDLDGWYDGRYTLALAVTMDLDQAAADEIVHWRSGDIRFIRLEASNSLAAGALRSITIDQAVRIIDSPNLLASDGEQATVEFGCQLRSDAAGSDDEFLQVVVQSGLAAWATTAPNVPTALASSRVVEDAATMTWVAPTTGGAPEWYDLRWRVKTPAGAYSSQRVYGLTHRITGLTAGETYEMSVRAANGAGASAYTAAIDVTTDAT